MTGAAHFPFTAVVGHDEVKLALLLNAVDPRIGGVLLRGEKGSAKSTLARGFAALLAAPFVELPVGATEDRVVGSIDVQAALTGGGRRLQPGLLADADGGVLYVDEINLLPDHLVDVLLDVAASGINRVERDGMSESHASRFVLIGSMNPEEGDLRPQLLDRFGLAVDVASSADPETRARAVAHRLDFDRDPGAFLARWAGDEGALRSRLAAGVAPAELPADLVVTVSALCAKVGAEGLRADLVICRAAAALAGWEGREVTAADDVRRVANLALAHRRRRSPFEAPGIDQGEIDDALDDVAPSVNGNDGDADADAGDGDGDGDGDEHPNGRPRPPAPAPADPPAPVVALAAPRRSGSQPSGGRRSPARGRRGRLVGDRPPETPTGPIGPVAVTATVRAAVGRRAVDPDDARWVAPADLREAVREERVGNLLVLAVDASGSMGAQQRMEAVKGAVLSLLLDAYQRRDRVALVTFGAERADVVLRPTASVEVARSRLTDLATGGRTPLAAGIDQALAVATAQPAAGHRPLLVLLSDGRATFAADGADPLQAALDAAGAVRRHGVPAVVIDAETSGPRLALAGTVAEAMGARLLSLHELSAGALAGALRAVTAQ